MTVLSQRFLHLSADLPSELYPSPAARDLCLYIHTSSATSVVNLKCVPLSHELVLSSCRTQLAWLMRSHPHQNFEHLRVFGWSPFSHILSISLDIGAHTFLTTGCYIFAIKPPSYLALNPQTESPNRYHDSTSILLRAMLDSKSTAFAGVPLVLEGLMKSWIEDVAQREEINQALQTFKVFICGGAKTSQECIQWANERQLPLILSIGMTELGGEHPRFDFACRQ